MLMLSMLPFESGNWQVYIPSMCGVTDIEFRNRIPEGLILRTCTPYILELS